MTEREIEAAVAQMGTRITETAGDGELLDLGEDVIPILVRVLQDVPWCEELWERLGREHEGEMLIEVNPEAAQRARERAGTSGETPLHEREEMRLSQRTFLKTLKVKASSHLGSFRAAREEPILSIYAKARQELSADARAKLPPDFLNARQGTAERAWQDFLRACGGWQLGEIETFFAGLDETRGGRFRPTRQSAAQAGWQFAWMSAMQGEVAPEQARVLRFFEEHGAGIDESLNANMTQTPLHRAAQSNDVERVRWLVGHGANVHEFDGDGWTPLMLAAQGDGLIGQRDLGKMEATLTFLLEHGALIEEREEADADFPDFAAPPIWEVADEDARAFLHVWRAREDAKGGANEVE